MSIRLGLNAKLYRLAVADGPRASWGTLNTATGIVENTLPPNTTGTPKMTAVPNVRDITIPLDGTEVDVTTRGSGGYAAAAVALFKVGVDLEMVYDTADADWIALMTAHLGRTAVDLAFLDGVQTVVGTYGLWASWTVQKAEKAEPVDGVQMFKFSLKPAKTSVPPEWVTITA